MMLDENGVEGPSRSWDEKNQSADPSDWQIHKCWFRHAWFRRMLPAKSVLVKTLNKSIDSLSLGRSITDSLRESGVHTLGDLLSRSELEISKIPDIGNICLHAATYRLKEVFEEALASQSGVSRQSDYNVREERRKPTKKVPLRNLRSHRRPCESRRDTMVRTIGQCLWNDLRGNIDQKHFEKVKGESVFLIRWSPKLMSYFRGQGIWSIGELMSKPEDDFLLYPRFKEEKLTEIYSKLRVLLRSYAALPTPIPIESGNFQIDPNLLKILVDSIMGELPEAEKTILRQEFGLWDGVKHPFDQIGEGIGLTRERVRQIKKQTIKDLNKMRVRVRVLKSIVKLHEEILSPYIIAHWGIASGVELLDEIMNLKGSPAINQLAYTFISNVFFGGKSVFVLTLTECRDDIYALNLKIAEWYKTIISNAKHHLKRFPNAQPLEAIMLYLQKAEPTVGEVNPAFVHRCLELCKNIHQDSAGCFLFEEIKVSAKKKK